MVFGNSLENQGLNLYRCYIITHIWAAPQWRKTMNNIDKRIITGKGDIICFKVWDVHKSQNYPKGKKFTFVFIHNNRRFLGYDNCEGKGCHKHFIDLDRNKEFEVSINEQDILTIFRKFKKEIGELTKKLYEGDGT